MISPTKQGMFNELAKLLWPRHRGDVWPGDVTMKLMEIEHEWRSNPLAGAIQIIEEADEESDEARAVELLAEALPIVARVLQRR